MDTEDRLTRRRISFTELDLSLRFRGHGSPLAVRARELTYVWEADVVAECRLTFALTSDAYLQVDREHLFHLAPETRGPGADRFVPAGPVHVEAGLAPEMLPGLVADAAQPRSAGRLLDALSRARVESPLLETESWFALSVTAQSDEHPVGLEGSLDVGYATTWASGGGAPRPGLLAVVEQVLDDRGWTYEYVDDDTAIRWRMGSPSGAWSCCALARDDDSRLAVYSVLDAVVPASRRAEAAGLIARANHGLAVGNWELDMDAGTLRFKASIDVAGDRLSVALAHRLIERNLSVVDTYLPGFTAFAASLATAAEALADAERTPK